MMANAHDRPGQLTRRTGQLAGPSVYLKVKVGLEPAANPASISSPLFSQVFKF